MSNIIKVKKTKGPLTLEQFVSTGQAIADIYKEDEEEQAKAIGRYFDSVFIIEQR